MIWAQRGPLGLWCLVCPNAQSSLSSFRWASLWLSFEHRWGSCHQESGFFWFGSERLFELMISQLALFGFDLHYSEPTGSELEHWWPMLSLSGEAIAPHSLLLQPNFRQLFGQIPYPSSASSFWSLFLYLDLNQRSSLYSSQDRRFDVCVHLCLLAVLSCSAFFFFFFLLLFILWLCFFFRFCINT